MTDAGCDPGNKKIAHIHHGLVLSPKTIMKNRKEFKNVAHKNL